MGTELTCPQCDYHTNKSFNLKRHIASRHNDLPATISSDTHNVSRNTHIVSNNTHIVSNTTHNVSNNTQNVNRPIPHVCSVCSKVFDRKYNMERHQAQCKGPRLQCHQCKANFTSRQAKFKHMKLCKASESQVLANAPTTNITNNTTNIQAQNVQNAQTINNNNNIHIHINNIGEEDLSHITNEMLDRRLKEFYGQSLANLIYDVHFHPDHPHNHNIRMLNRKNKTLNVREDNRWAIRFCNDITDRLTFRYKNILITRLLDEEFQQNLEHETDFSQIQRDICSIDKKRDPESYYGVIHRILAAIEDLDNRQNQAQQLTS